MPSFIKRKSTIRLLAVLFLLVILGESASHGFVLSDRSYTPDEVVSTDPGSHEDPCGTMVLCSDNKNKDREIPGFGHDASQHNALFDRLGDLSASDLSSEEVLIPFADADARFRPPDPPFHPPELS